MVKNIILASRSKQRQKLLEMLDISYKIVAADVDEDVRIEDISPEEYVSGLAVRKCRAAYEKIDEREDTLVIAADTIVYYDGLILGKPADEADAFTTLTMLSGEWHEVYTGYALMCNGKLYSSHEMTRVHFRALSHDEIDNYIQTGDPMNKAGSYGIQSLGSVFVDKIEGDYFNVVGLPVTSLTQCMKDEFDFDFMVKK